MHPSVRLQSRGLSTFAGAAALGVVAGLAINPLRKFAMQHAEAAAGDWAQVLKLEHRAVDALFKMLLQTRDNEKIKRGLLLSKIAYALNKHALQEENVIYPALREEDRPSADHLATDHAQIKSYIFELEQLEKDDPMWLPKVRAFHELLLHHIAEEENEIFPKLEASLSPAQTAKLTHRMHLEGMKLV